MIRIRLKIYYYRCIQEGEKSNLKSGTDKANKLPCKKSDDIVPVSGPFKSVEKISSGAVQDGLIMI